MGNIIINLMFFEIINPGIPWFKLITKPIKLQPKLPNN